MTVPDSTYTGISKVKSLPDKGRQVGGIISKNREESSRKSREESFRKMIIGQQGIISKFYSKGQGRPIK